MPATPAQCEKELARCREQLGQIGYISEGSVVRRKPEQGGSPFSWTRKVEAKTINVSLSETQYEWLKTAIANRRKAGQLLKKMERLSREILFATIPGVTRRKKLSRKVLGLI